MKLRAVGTRLIGSATVVLPAVAVLLTASCSSPDEIVFDGAAPEETVISVTAAPTTTGPAAVSTPPETTPAAMPGTTMAAAPTATTSPPTLALTDRGIVELPGQVVVNDIRTGSVTILGPRAEQFEPFAAPGEELHQPTWSPDGALVAWSRATNDGFSVVVTSNAGGDATPYETPFGVFYMQWRPDGRAIGLLGASEPGRVGLAILDLDSETVTPLNSSSSYYFHWSPQGDEMITHLDGARVEQLDPSTGATSLLEILNPVNSVFQAAAWTPDGGSVLYIRPAVPASVGTEDELVIHDLGTGEIGVVGEGAGFFNFAVSPDGEAIAYSIRDPEGMTSMQIVDLATGRTEEIDAPFTLAWQWSPDSRKILLLGIGDRAMTVSVYESGTITRYQDIIPTATFVQNYLLFWSQYDLSHSLWAPDSSAFLFPAFDRNADLVFLQFLDDELPILLGPGSMAVFSPATPNP